MSSVGQETEGRRQESEGRRQKAGDRSQKAVARRQETEGRRQESEGSSQKAGDSSQKAALKDIAECIPSGTAMSATVTQPHRVSKKDASVKFIISV